MKINKLYPSIGFSKNGQYLCRDIENGVIVWKAYMSHSGGGWYHVHSPPYALELEEEFQETF